MVNIVSYECHLDLDSKILLPERLETFLARTEIDDAPGELLVSSNYVSRLNGLKALQSAANSLREVNGEKPVTIQPMDDKIHIAKIGFKNRETLRQLQEEVLKDRILLLQCVKVFLRVTKIKQNLY